MTKITLGNQEYFKGIPKIGFEGPPPKIRSHSNGMNPTG